MRSRIPFEWIIGVAGSLAIHGMWLVGEASAGTSKGDSLPSLTEVVLEPAPEPKEEPAPAPQAPAEPEAKDEPEQPAVTSKQAPQDSTPRSSAPPAPAQAGQTMTAPDNAPSDGVADFTMVQGAGTGYAGGTTASEGTSQKAVHGPASPGGRPDAPRAGPIAPPKPAAPAKDLSRPAMPASNDWSCSHLFPSDPEAGNHAVVVIVVTVRPDGTPRSIGIMQDPGHGFGAAARTCALSQRYTPAVDRDGQPTTASTPPITVRFTR